MKTTILFFVLVAETYGQWTELEVRRMLEETNERHAQIEKMTKEAAMRHNQINPDGQSERNGGAITSATVPMELPTSVPLPTELPPQQFVIRPAPPPTIEDDRTFLAKMSEQETLVNQLNSIATREAVSRNGLLVMESALLNALRPLAVPFIGAGPPIPGHFVPFQRMQRPLEQSSVDSNNEVQPRPPAPQLPMRTNNIEPYAFQKDEQLEELRNYTEQS